MSTQSEPTSLAKTLAEEVLASSADVSPDLHSAPLAKTISEGNPILPREPLPINVHPYFTVENWPIVEGLVKAALKENGFDSIVDAATTRDNGSQAHHTEMAESVISIRSMPEKDDRDAVELKKIILDKLAIHGFEQQIDISFEPAKRIARHIPPPIDTKRTHKKEASSLSVQPSPFPLLSPTEQEAKGQASVTEDYLFRGKPNLKGTKQLSSIKFNSLLMSHFLSQFCQAPNLLVLVESWCLQKVRFRVRILSF